MCWKVFVFVLLKLNSWNVNSMNFWIKPRIEELIGWNWFYHVNTTPYGIESETGGGHRRKQGTWP
jgi:hypothetical protein